MNNTITYKKIIVIACIATILLGIFMHFAYELSNENILVGFLTPVNESVWEHLKLLFIPFTLFGIAFYFYTKGKFSNMFLTTVFGNVAGMFVIVTLHYLGTLIFGQTNMIYGIIIYALGVITAYVTLYLGIYNLEFAEETADSKTLAVCTLALMFTLFILNTFYPIKLNITKDPVTKTYGIHKIV